MTVEFRLLGPVEAVVDGSPVALGGRKPRAVLAMLLLSRNAVVSADRLVDGLWGESPPEGAANAVQAYVSRLRAALHDRASDANGTQMLVTRAPGYVLRVAAERLDLGRFEALVARSRAGETNGDRRHTRSLLVEAEGLWRGDALAEFADEPFALLDGPRLAEMRLAAIEERLALDLELGGHAEAVGEVEHLARTHPYRERITELLMLALYRCGRQTEALAAYGRLRATLADEMGLEPGHALRTLQRAILEQDPSLAGTATVDEPDPIAGATHNPGRVRRRSLGAFAAVAAIVAVGVAGLSGGRRSPPALHAGSVAVLDARTGTVVNDLPFRGSLGSATVLGGGLWVADAQTDTLKRIDLARGTVRTVGLGVRPTSLAAADGLIWVGSATDRSVLRFDPQLGTFRRPIPIKADVGAIGTPAATLTAGAGSVWVDTGGSGGVWRIDPATGRVAAKVTGVQTGMLAADPTAVWVVGDFFSSGRIDRIDADRARRTASIPLPGGAIVGIATGAGAVWVATSDGTVWRIDPSRNALVRTIPVGKGLSGIAVADGSVWVTNAATGVADRIDPGTDRVTARVPLGQSATGVTAAGGRLYVTLAGQAPAPAETGGGIRVVLNSGVDSIDPAVSFWGTMWQIEYATGRPLLNYPDRAGLAGTRLVPDAAIRMPATSPDRRTYKFELRPGMRFSSGAPITSESFRYAIERALSPTMGSFASTMLGDLVGAQRYIKGRVAHITGIRTPDARTIAFTLVRPDPSFLARIAMLFFTPVPVGTPARPAQTRPIASAGPYMVAEYRPNQVLVLRRNPYYNGPRLRSADTIDYLLDTRQPGTRLVLENWASYLADPLSAQDTSRLLRARGRQVLVAPYLTVDYLALNTRQPPLNRPGVRRALALAVNRSALARTLGAGQASVTDQYLPPAVPGYQGNGLAYNLFRGDIAGARRALRGADVTKPLRLTLLTCDDSPCAARADLLRRELHPLGVEIRVKAMSRDREFAVDTAHSATFDIADEGFVLPFLDPGAGVFALTAQARFDLPASFAKANSLSPAARDQALGRILERIAKDDAPLIAYAVSNTATVGSKALGCVVAQPVYGTDLTRLCLRH